MASGLAAGGMVPFASSYAAFCPGRSWEQFKTTACLNERPVKIVGSHAGLMTGPDGATHQIERRRRQRCRMRSDGKRPQITLPWCGRRRTVVIVEESAVQCTSDGGTACAIAARNATASRMSDDAVRIPTRSAGPAAQRPSQRHRLAVEGPTGMRVSIGKRLRFIDDSRRGKRDCNAPQGVFAALHDERGRRRREKSRHGLRKLAEDVAS